MKSHKFCAWVAVFSILWQSANCLRKFNGIASVLVVKSKQLLKIGV